MVVVANYQPTKLQPCSYVYDASALRTCALCRISAVRAHLKLKCRIKRRASTILVHARAIATMQAVVFNSAERNLALVQLPRARPARQQALVRVSRAGVCGTDLHLISGGLAALLDKNQLILGHEFCGELVEDAGTMLKGQRVVVQPMISCTNFCPLCAAGRYNLCSTILGFTADGGWTQLCCVPLRCVHPLPDSLPDDIAALIEPLGVLVTAWRKLNPTPTLDSRVAVLGTGIIGLLMLSILHYRGYRQLLGVDPIGESSPFG